MCVVCVLCVCCVCCVCVCVLCAVINRPCTFTNFKVIMRVMDHCTSSMFIFTECFPSTELYYFRTTRQSPITPSPAKFTY